MNSGTRLKQILENNIYDSRNFNELGNSRLEEAVRQIYDSRNFNELGNEDYASA